MTLAALLLAIAVAAAVQVVSGFGFALVAAPVLVTVTDPITSVSILAVVGAIVSALTLTTTREPREILGRQAALLLAWAVPGIVAGALLVSRIEEDAVRVAVGVLVLAALAQRARSSKIHVPLPVAGLFSGAMTTSTALNGPPLVLYLTARDTPARATRDTLALLFVVLDLVGVAALAATGNLHLPTETLALPVAGLLGVLIGQRIFDRMTEPQLQRVITGTLVVSACVALSSPLH